MKLLFTVQNQTLSRIDKFDIVENSINYLEIEFNFSSDWENTVKRVYFSLDKQNWIIVPLDENNTCIVPFDMIKYPGFYLYLVGEKGNQRITTNIPRTPIYITGTGNLDGKHSITDILTSTLDIRRNEESPNNVVIDIPSEYTESIQEDIEKSSEFTMIIIEYDFPITATNEVYRNEILELKNVIDDRPVVIKVFGDQIEEHYRLTYVSDGEDSTSYLFTNEGDYSINFIYESVDNYSLTLNKSPIQQLLDNKADKYNVYEKNEIDNKLILSKPFIFDIAYNDIPIFSSNEIYINKIIEMTKAYVLDNRPLQLNLEKDSYIYIFQFQYLENGEDSRVFNFYNESIGYCRIDISNDDSYHIYLSNSTTRDEIIDNRNAIQRNTSAIAAKADKVTTYTKTEVNNLLENKQQIINEVERKVDDNVSDIEDLQSKTSYVESYTEDNQLHLGRGVEIVEIGRNGQLSVDDGVPNVRMNERNFDVDDTNEIVNKKYIRYKLNELLDQVPEGANTLKKLYDAIIGNTTNINDLRLILDNKFPLDDYDELSKLVIQSNSNDGIIEIGLDGINIGLWDKDINIDIAKEWDSHGNINLTVADFIINLINPDLVTFKIKDFTTNEILFEVKSNGVYSKGQRILDDRDYEIIIEMMENYATYENTYTRDEIDNKLGSKVNTNDVYTKNTIDSLLNNKVNVDNVYTKAEIDSKYQELDNKITLQDIRDTRLEDYLADKDWAAINNDSSTGYIRNYLSVGDQLNYDWIDTYNGIATTYNVANNILDFEDETSFKDEQGIYTAKSMVMEWEKAIPFNIEYSPSQAWLTLTNGLPAGTYCIYVSDIKTHDGWQNVRPLYEGKYLTFTLTKPIPSGGQLRGWNIGTTASDLWGVRTYSAWDNHTLIEGVTFTVNTSIVGTYLGKSWGALNTNEIVDNISVGGVTYSIGRINHWERVAYGSNRYKHSVVRRWLNSDALNGEWYVKCEDDPYEVKSTRADLLKRNGFMAGLPTTFKNNLKATKLTIHVASVDVSIADDVANEVDIMYDKVFLLTATQMARASESIGDDVVKEGAPYEYYRLLANSQYNNASMTKYGDNWYFKLWTTYRILKRKAINGGYVNYWQSGCRRSYAYGAWIVHGSGFVGSNLAYGTGVRCLPAFKIGGNRA